jgi:hypothetical protein
VLPQDGLSEPVRTTQCPPPLLAIADIPTETNETTWFIAVCQLAFALVLRADQPSSAEVFNNQQLERLIITHKSLRISNQRITIGLDFIVSYGFRVSRDLRKTEAIEERGLVRSIKIG